MIVLLKVALMWTTPLMTFFRIFFFAILSSDRKLPASVTSRTLTQGHLPKDTERCGHRGKGTKLRGQTTVPSYIALMLFLVATTFLGPFRVRALVLVRWPR